jgi:TolB-like protein
MQSLKPIRLAFFSYVHEDAEFALRLAKDLRAAGAAVWMDRLDIKVGQDRGCAVEEALAKCPQLLLILSPTSVASSKVMSEVSFALEEGKTILPVIHRNCKIPIRLRCLQNVDLTLNYDEGLGRLLEALEVAAPPPKMPEDAVKQVGQSLGDPSDPDSSRRGSNVWKKRIYSWLVPIGGVLIVVLAFRLNHFGLERRPQVAGLAIPEKSIAVLPFENLSRDPDNGYFADGIEDEILTGLSKIADLKVVSRTSTQHYRSAPENPRKIAKQLGVAYILKGSVQKSADSVRVNVLLINAVNGSHLWAKAFDRKLTDNFSVATEIAKGVAEQLQASTPTPTLTSSPTVTATVTPTPRA